MDIRIGILAAAMAVAVPGMAEGQLSDGQWRLPTGKSGTAGVVPKAQPQVVIVQPQQTFHRRAFPRRSGGATIIPAVLLADGRIFANFGFGYEQVYRSCSGAVVLGEPAVIGSNGVVLSPAQRPTYTQPVPNQQTVSQTVFSSGQNVVVSGATQNVVVSGAQTACFSRNGAGQIFVYSF